MKIGLMAFLFILLLSAQAMACDCPAIHNETALERYELADNVVEARVLLVSKGWGGSGPLATLEMMNVMKGEKIDKDVVVIQYNPFIGACGMTLVEGETYILGLYDIRNVNSTKARVGQFRAMDSCSQSAIGYYLKHSKKEK